MTRATLLHVLDQPTALGPAEVRELEQLAQAFPYCQTAHLLLAKAAHDQGTMLAGQRLRRAATYAADRALLRRLIEQVEPTPEAQPVAEETPLDAGPEAPIVAAAPPAPLETPRVVESVSAPVETPAVETPAVETPAVEASGPTSVLAPEQPAPAVIAAAEIPIIPEVELPVQAAEQAVGSAVSAAPPVLPDEQAPVEAPAREVPAAEASPLVATPASEEFAAAELPVLPPPPHVATAAVASPAALPEIPSAREMLLPAPETEPEPPLQAPAIRPPVEVGEARFEYGLADTPVTPSAPTYELPSLVDEWAASAVTRGLAGPGLLPEGFAAATAAAAGPVLTLAAFTGDTAVGYGYGESSRLGFSLQLLNLLADKAEAEASATPAPAEALPPAGPLPPSGAFFEPDPLLLEHWAAHVPLAPAVPSSLDLINNFLRRQPRLTRQAMLPPTPASQADLSVRSTQVEPDLVSESLARILVRQGKAARAIEIYEKLVVKQPEKADYFRKQIQQLQLTNKLGS